MLNPAAEMLARKLLVKQANSIHARVGSDDAWSTADDDTFTEFYSAAELAVEHAHEEEVATRACHTTVLLGWLVAVVMTTLAGADTVIELCVHTCNRICSLDVTVVAIETDPESYGGKRKAKKAAKTARKAKEAQYKLCLKVLRQWVIDN